MKDRIKSLRKTLGLTQQEFADRLGISRGNIATYETRKGNPGSSVIGLICREFNVNEEWLRTGEGEIFSPKPETVVDELVHEYGLDDLDRRILHGYLRLSESDRAAVKRYVRSLFDDADVLASAAPVDQHAAWEAEARAEAEQVYREILAEKKAEAASSASPYGSSDGTKGA